MANWSIQSDCVSCHTAEARGGGTHSTVYANHKDLACPECHTDEASSLSATHKDYSNAKPPTKLTTTKVEITVCKQCHSDQDLTDKTLNSTTLTDKNGTVVNPHNMPEVNEHIAARNCASCHKMHQGDSAEEVTKKLCISCHHESVYECNTCHQ